MPSRYTTKHSGTAILCGSAPCVFEDLEKARAMRPGAVVLGVNNTPAMIPEIEHIWTQHNNLAQQFKDNAKRKIFVHGRACIMGDFADYIWPSLDWVNGSSGVAGALWAKIGMGFDEVIMAGIPLSRLELHYAEQYPSKYTKNTGFATENQVDQWIGHLNMHINNGLTKGIYSMSGTTAYYLGQPNA
jgi:hypothetical protein